MKRKTFENKLFYKCSCAAQYRHIVAKKSISKIQLVFFVLSALLKVSHKAKYLRLITDNELNFAAIIKSLKDKAARSLRILTKLRYFYRKKTLIKIYYSFIHYQIINL